ncbi:hypothetical protein KC850_04315, partial [Candidatus Kaiserbacteria bacterium]|nr:hypothetical protein [Candidatus Kaiserbacteria bacterium]
MNTHKFVQTSTLQGIKMKELVNVTSTRKTEIDKPCVGACVNDFVPTDEHRRTLSEHLAHIEAETYGGVKQEMYSENTDNFMVYFFLPKSVSNFRMQQLKRILANALEKSGITHCAEVI